MKRRNDHMARMCFEGGELFVSAHDPYETEVLIEHAMDRARRTGGVRVVVHGRAWSVQHTQDRVTHPCAGCQKTLGVAWCATAADADRYCLRCAFHPDTQTRSNIPNPRPRITDGMTTSGASAEPSASSALSTFFRWAGLSPHN